MIRLESLTKRFPVITAVDNVSIEVSQGELFGFLGPNGAGKTTTIKMMAGLLRPTSGKALIGGIDMAKRPIEAKGLIGFVPDTPFVYPKLTAREFLIFSGNLYGIEGRIGEERIAKLLDLFELDARADELVENYSHGMRQRLVLSAALLHRPKIIIVDEPMVGLDPKCSLLTKRILRTICDEGGAVFMSTHAMDVAEQMCDRISIINDGKIIATGTLEELRRRAGGGEERLERIFLRLTGEAEREEILNILGP